MAELGKDIQISCIMYIGIKFKHCCYNYFNLSKISKKSSSKFYEFYSAHKYIDPNWLSCSQGLRKVLEDYIAINIVKVCLLGLTQKGRTYFKEIQSVLGFGKVYFYISANVYRQRVTTKSENLKLTILFNCKFATINKINQLKLRIVVLNAVSVKLTFKPNPFLPSLNDSWLSGFTTAEGYFFVSVFKQKYKKEVLYSEGNLGITDTISQLVRIKFVLDQKEESILLHIKNIFGVGILKKTKTADIGVFRYNLGSFQSNSITVDFFLAYPLKDKKNCFP